MGGQREVLTRMVILPLYNVHSAPQGFNLQKSCTNSFELCTGALIYRYMTFSFPVWSYSQLRSVLILQLTSTVNDGPGLTGELDSNASRDMRQWKSKELSCIK